MDNPNPPPWHHHQVSSPHLAHDFTCMHRTQTRNELDVQRGGARSLEMVRFLIRRGGVLFGWGEGGGGAYSQGVCVI